MNTWLLTWNPDYWKWEMDDSWSCGRTKRIEKGDRLFLLRQGREPRGIVASGYAESAPYPDRHWDESRGGETMYVDIRYDPLLDPERGGVLPLSRLQKGLLAKVNWRTQRSGILIEPSAAAELEKLWHPFINAFGKAPNSEIDKIVDAERVMVKLLPNLQERVLVLDRLIKSVDVANSLAPNAWAVTLKNGNGEYGFRLNVGSVEALVFLNGELRINLVGSSGVKPFVGNCFNATDYHSIQQPQCAFYGNVKQYARIAQAIQPAHEQFLDLAAKTSSGKPRKGTSYRNSHHEGLIQYARNVLKGHGKNAYLFLWNPKIDESSFSNYESLVMETAPDNPYEILWICPSKRPRPGDRAYMKRSGSSHNGIYARGWIETAPGMRKGEQCVKLRIEQFLPLGDEITKESLGRPPFWGAQASGTTIKLEFAEKIDRIWPPLVSMKKSSVERSTKDQQHQEKASDHNVEVMRGAGFGDALMNKEIEVAAVQYVTGELQRDGYIVESVESQNLGYDLLCTKPKEQLKVEVKGVGGKAEEFIITENERKVALKDPQYMLAIVLNAISKPELKIYPGSEISRAFNIRPLQYKATKR